ncbi:Dolichyl-phosphate-mannose-protein mannosyltransferase [Stigmatella aurantiaca]|uniref:Dolichyl-phosphate-mannose-protein mannosyltransferase n=1 Tax=Stigmatella aurantiaca TaxID=41 RepID=A0A1H8BPE5_STIAU|nr:glycosyltransferase family 39 protein [Stigmatella aurantiaca]SEM84656.1 Dolichyl-phosphate-mannose-protein mannosyltransferase [Stigmatella aurantiaca]
MRAFLSSTWRLCARHSLAVGLVATFLLSLLLRLLYLQASPDRDWPFSIFFYGDSRFFHLTALEQARHQPPPVALPYHPPLFPGLLGMLYGLLGEPRGSAFPYKLCLAVLHSATVALSWAWWRRLLGPAWGLLATALFASSFGWLVLSTTYSNEVLYVFFLSATCGLVLRARDGQLTAGTLVLLGAAMGLGALTRAEHLYLWPFLLAYALFTRPPGSPLKPLLGRWAAAVLVSLVLLVPTALRNARMLQELNARAPALEPLPELTLVTAYGPINFAMANNARATGGFTPDLINQMGQAGHLDPSNPAQRHLLLHGYAEGLRWLAENPGEGLRLWLAKLARWLEGLSLGFGLSDWPSGLTGARAPVDVFVPEHPWLHWPLALLLLIGAGLSLRAPFRAFSLCTAVVLHRLLVTLAFFGYARGMLVLFPVLVPLILLPFIVFIYYRPRLSHKVPLFLAGATLLFWVEAGALALGEPRQFMASGSTERTSGKLIQDDWVRIWPKP